MNFDVHTAHTLFYYKKHEVLNLFYAALEGVFTGNVENDALPFFITKLIFIIINLYSLPTFAVLGS